MAHSPIIRIRRVPKRLSWRRRCGYGQELTCNDQVKLHLSRKYLLRCLMLREDRPEDPDIDNFLLFLITKHLSICCVEDIPLASCNKDR